MIFIGIISAPREPVDNEDYISSYDSYFIGFL